MSTQYFPTKEQQAVLEEAATTLWGIQENPGIPYGVRDEAGQACAALRAMLPKPKYRARDRQVIFYPGGVYVVEIPRTVIPDDATANLKTEQIAAILNYNEEVEG